jgi:hypothetical protein
MAWGEGSRKMWGIILIVLLIWAGLVVLLWAGSVWFQGYIYSEPAPQLVWAAPVAGSALALFFALWCIIDYKSPGRYVSLFDFSARDPHEPFSELWAVKGTNTTRYTPIKDARGHAEYLDRNGKPVPTHPDRILVKEDGEEITFEPERDANGNFKIRPGNPLLYYDSQGRQMRENNLGQLSTFRSGIFLACLFLNFFHLALWFVCLWLLLRFQWSHALGLAVIFWLVMTVFGVPALLAKVETAATSPRVSGVLRLQIAKCKLQI